MRLFADDANLTFSEKSTALLEQKMNAELLKVDHHHHFAPGMCFLLFLDPSRGSPHAGVSWFFAA